MERMNTSPSPGRARPFKAESSLRRLPLPYPRHDEVALLTHSKSPWGREAFVRLWLTEGAPYAFRGCPDVYEDVRAWIGSQLDVYPKDITLVGSARLGFSLRPPPKYGEPFGGASDLDVALVSPALFEELHESFLRWRQDYQLGAVKPRNEKERGYWDDNLGRLDHYVGLGFLDAKKLPTFDRYPISKKMNNAMWALREKLRVTPGAPVPSGASVRVYRSWEQLVCRVAFNLDDVLRRIAA